MKYEPEHTPFEKFFLVALVILAGGFFFLMGWQYGVRDLPQDNELKMSSLQVQKLGGWQGE